ncbi:MAG: hypothetical protein ACOYON_09635 [Fimbriimonas sp.]
MFFLLLASPPDPFLTEALAYRKLTPLHQELRDMVASTAALCRDPKMMLDVHYQPGIRTYANALALQKGTAKVGATLVKEKYERKTDTKPSLITAMRKARPGTGADKWDYLLVNLKTGQPFRSPSCLGCHQDFRTTDGISPDGAALLKAWQSKHGKG